MTVRQAAARIDADLRAAAEPGRADHEAAYLHSDRVHYGVRVPAVRAAVRAVLRGWPGLTHDDLVALVGLLWDEPAGEPVHERRLAAALLLVERHRLMSLDDVPLWERLIRESGTWALVDVLAASAAGPVLAGTGDENNAAATAVLDRWAVDGDFWVRRSALLVHLGSLRAGAGDWARFTRYAEAMLGEKEFFVRKAIGWVLRDTSRRRPGLVFAWVRPRAAQLSGVTVREAVKYLEPAQRAQILALRA